MPQIDPNAPTLEITDNDAAAIAELPGFEGSVNGFGYRTLRIAGEFSGAHVFTRIAGRWYLTVNHLRIDSEWRIRAIAALAEVEAA